MDFVNLADRKHEAFGLTRYCFGDYEAFINWALDRADNIYALMAGGKPVAQIIDTRADICVRGKAYAASLISHVCVAPEYRGQRVMPELMGMTLDTLRRDGVAIAQLYPNSHEYYTRYGFADCGEAVVMTVPLSTLHGAFGPCSNLWTGPALDADTAALLMMYGGAMREYSGWVIRDETRMRQRLAELAIFGAYAVYTRDVQYNGYAVYHFENNMIVVDEFVAGDADSRKHLLAFFGSHMSTHSTVRITTSADDPLRRLVLDRKGMVSLEPWSMYCVLDYDAFGLSDINDISEHDKTRLILGDAHREDMQDSTLRHWRDAFPCRPVWIYEQY